MIYYEKHDQYWLAPITYINEHELHEADVQEHNDTANDHQEPIWESSLEELL